MARLSSQAAPWPATGRAAAAGPPATGPAPWRCGTRSSGRRMSAVVFARRDRDRRAEGPRARDLRGAADDGEGPEERLGALPDRREEGGPRPLRAAGAHEIGRATRLNSSHEW